MRSAKSSGSNGWVGIFVELVHCPDDEVDEWSRSVTAQPLESILEAKPLHQGQKTRSLQSVPLKHGYFFFNQPPSIIINVKWGNC
jgi:hypothetical protein